MSHTQFAGQHEAQSPDYLKHLQFQQIAYPPNMPQQRSLRERTESRVAHLDTHCLASTHTSDHFSLGQKFSPFCCSAGTSLTQHTLQQAEALLLACLCSSDGAGPLAETFLLPSPTKATLRGSADETIFF